MKLIKKAIKNPELYSKDSDYRKYIAFKLDKETNKYSLTLDIDKILKRIKNSGLMIIVGNEKILSEKTVINIYRNKNVIEESFDRLKII
jgi:transposase